MPRKRDNAIHLERHILTVKIKENDRKSPHRIGFSRLSTRHSYDYKGTKSQENSLQHHPLHVPTP